MDLAAGQSWTYRAPSGFETSRLLIGAIASFDGEQQIVCASAVHAPRRGPDGHFERVTIPFLPMTEAAFRASIVGRDDTPEPLPEGFAEKLAAWQNDPKGLTTFTVPFEGFLDQMIARQMAEIAAFQQRSA